MDPAGHWKAAENSGILDMGPLIRNFAGLCMSVNRFSFSSCGRFLVHQIYKQEVQVIRKNIRECLTCSGRSEFGGTHLCGRQEE